MTGDVVVDKINTNINKVRLKKLDTEGALLYETFETESKTAISPKKQKDSATKRNVFSIKQKTQDEIIEEMINKDFSVPPCLYQLENYKNYRNKLGLAAVRH